MNSELWNKWESCHNDVDQQKRIASAKKAACSPILLDQTTMSAQFSGSSGNHSTTLEKCSCIDFNRRKLPCKHMYRLAMELELLDEAFDSDINAVASKNGSNSLMNIADTIKIVESLSEIQQKYLHRITSKIKNKNHVVYVSNKDIEDLQPLIDCGLLIKTPDNEGVLSKIPVQYSPNIRSQKLHMYLHRKFDKYYSFDGGSIQYSDVPLLETTLPEDDVTDLLRKYRYYK